jgi:hypothetical protein
MLYEDAPWFDATTRIGMYDLFLPLTPNVILCPGFVGRYGAEADATGISPWQFYMVRSPLAGATATGAETPNVPARGLAQIVGGVLGGEH